MTPQRIQLSRRKGFRLQAHSLALNGLHAVKVDRTTRWGNPFRITQCADEWRIFRDGDLYATRSTKDAASKRAIELFEFWLQEPAQRELLEEIRVGLRGVNLACWCGASSPCHADAILKLLAEPTKEKANA